MKTKSPVIVVKIINDIVLSMNQRLSPIVVNYVFGRQIQIINRMHDLNSSTTLKGTKYPLLALFQDFPERRGVGHYAVVTIPRIIIATLTNSTDPPNKRYGLTFEPILYPIYDEFLHQLSKHGNIVEEDEDNIPHTKWDRPGSQPEGSDLNDYIDAIELSNLTITVSQTKSC